MAGEFVIPSDFVIPNEWILLKETRWPGEQLGAPERLIQTYKAPNGTLYEASICTSHGTEGVSVSQTVIEKAPL